MPPPSLSKLGGIGKTIGELFGGLFGRGNADNVFDTNITESIHAVLKRDADELRAMGMTWRESTPPGEGVWVEGPGVVCSDPVLLQNRIAELSQQAARESELKRTQSKANWVFYGAEEFSRAYGLILSKCAGQGVSGVLGNVAASLGVERKSLTGAGFVIGLVIVGVIIFAIVKRAVR